MSRGCGCFEPARSSKKWHELKVHPDRQDRDGDAWKHLQEIIKKAVVDKSEVFAPREYLSPEEWDNIETLPAEISNLKSVRELILYGSNLVRIPPEIGEMSALQRFDSYTSYKLHWFPYEIIRCQKLVNSRVSTRALYGNYKYRPPFPSLRGNPVEFVAAPACSICGVTSTDMALNQVWVSVKVATDVMPLLAHACSKSCIEKLRSPAENYIPKAHKGGLGQNQPPRQW